MRRVRAFIAIWAAGLVIGILAGNPTLAAFSDATSNAGNTFTAAANFGGSGVVPIRDLGEASCGNTSNSLSVPAGGVPAGNTLIARLAHRTTVNAVVTIRDSQGNTWTKDADVFQGNVRIVVFSAYVSNAMSQNDEITVTFPGVGDAVGLTVEEFSGIAATNRVDAVGTGTGDSNSPSATLTTTNGNDLLFGAVASVNNRTYTEAAGWTTGKHQVIDCGGATRRADSHAANRTVSSTGSYTYNPTISASERWAAAVVAYRGAENNPSCLRPTLNHLTGFEYGPTQSPSVGLADGGAASSGGSPIVEASVSRNGSYALTIPKDATGASYVDKTLPVTPVAVAGFALRLDSLPSNDVSSLMRIDGTVGADDLDLEYHAATNRFEIAFGTDVATAGSVSVQAGRWYYFDLKVDYGTSPWTADWRIDGEDQPRATHTGTATTADEFRYGSDITNDVFTARFDDVFNSGVVADYPMGNARVLAVRPNGEGSSNTRTNFGNETGTLIGTNPHLRLDDNPLDSVTDYIWQDTASSTSYIELTFQDAVQTCIKGVSGIVSYNSSATGGNNGKTSIFSGTTERVIMNGDMSARGTALTYGRAVIAPPTSSWTQTALNGLAARFGYSTDIAPQPRWQGFVLEYGTLP